KVTDERDFSRNGGARAFTLRARESLLEQIDRGGVVADLDVGGDELLRGDDVIGRGVEGALEHGDGAVRIATLVQELGGAHAVVGAFDRRRRRVRGALPR